jgi:hypothetical protein
MRRAAAFHVALDLLAQLRGDGAAQQLVALFVQHVEARAARRRGQVAQPVRTGVLERDGGGVEDDVRRQADVQRRFRVALARLVAQPDRAADADRGRHLRQQDRQEEFPEQPSHGYSRISW